MDDRRALHFPGRVYRALLVVYPREFRDVYGARMVQAFEDLCREERRRGGASGLVELWGLVLLDLVRTAFMERSRTMRDRWLLVLVPVALAIGLAIALVDTSPNWDDTGVTAAAVLVVCGALGILRPRRAWLWALAVGLWIPALGIVLHQDHANYGSILALALAFAGAYAGRSVRVLATRARV